MKKLKIYLDTSVISHLYAPDRLDRQEDTRRLWEILQTNGHDVCLSPVVLLEIRGCSAPKLLYLLEQLKTIPYTELAKTDEVLALADKYLAAGILTQKSYEDCQHIAYAVVYDCDMIISWNFKHLVNNRIIEGVRQVNALAGYKSMPIISPNTLLGGNNDDT